MLSDFICSIVFFGFFGFLIYATVFRRKSRAADHLFTGSGEALRAATKPTPVGLYCEICGEHAGVVSTEEYQKLEPPVYCGSCKFVIERYRTRV
jgi:hypothetical protein